MVEDFLEKRKIRHVEIIAVNYIDLDEDYRKLENLDIAVLDINLKDKVNGLTIAQVIKKRNPYVALVFITSYDTYALQAWKLHSFGFLQKPVKIEDFVQVFQKIMLQLNGVRITKMNRMISLNSKIMVKERDIYCIEKISDTKDIQVTTSKNVYVFRGTIKEEQRLLCDSFIRISRSALINVHYIFRMEDGMVELSNEKIFPISASKEREIKAFLAKMRV